MVGSEIEEALVGLCLSPACAFNRRLFGRLAALERFKFCSAYRARVFLPGGRSPTSPPQGRTRATAWACGQGTPRPSTDDSAGDSKGRQCTASCSKGKCQFSGDGARRRVVSSTETDVLRFGASGYGSPAHQEEARAARETTNKIRVAVNSMSLPSLVLLADKKASRILTSPSSMSYAFYFLVSPARSGDGGTKNTAQSIAVYTIHTLVYSAFKTLEISQWQARDNPHLRKWATG
ncbi:CYFA0S24e00705g1_1 [Cyberlindnera fabianii]|uniref:CYFA0S24e00705g1_1 n=1 Tax=Cyberlindnera fabianii TaxID=36022 RepID=A0A061B9I3_CYBFA|nr:CYFA0S24e00705g1_1 [Cyberlindnera fabianii]